MAALAAPLILAGVQVLPQIIDLIVNLTQRHAPVAEAQLGSGTGAVKFGNVFGSVIGDLTKAATAGQIPKELPPDDVVKLIIQSTVASMKMGGQLDFEPAPSAAPGPTPLTTNQTRIALLAGQSLTITAK